MALHPFSQLCRAVSIVLIVWTMQFSCVAQAAGSDPFIIEMKSELKTVGDIKPAFIVYKDKPLPKVSINYVLKRYIKLFETASSPSVKLAALNRINNLRSKYKLSSKKLTIDKVKQSKVVLESYDRIIDTGVFYQRMDELLYQTAKATKFVGDEEESVKRLKLLVGLYPSSELYDESMFRMAESYFDLKEFSKAEAQYKKILAFSQKDTFHQRAKFKLGWSVFRQDRYLEAGELAVKVMDDYPDLKHATSIESLALDDQDLVDDTLRLFSILFSKQEGAESIEVLQKKIAHTDYAYLLYDALFGFYLRQDRFQDASVVAHAYTTHYPADFNAYYMATNAIKSYKHGKFDIKEWEAKEHFVNNFGVDSNYWSALDVDQLNIVQPLIVANLAELAHLYFVRMQTAFDQPGVAKADRALTKVEFEHKVSSYHSYAKQAAEYYLQLVKTRGKHQYNGQSLYLAAEALFKIESYGKAIDTYERAAYEQPGHANAIKAGYAAILAYDKIADKNKLQNGALTETQRMARRASIERFAKYFPLAKQTPALLNNLANDLFREEDYVQAEQTAARVVSVSGVSQDVLYSSWLVSAHSNFELQNYKKSEHAYQQLLAINPEKDSAVLSERLAASIYKQAENETVITQSAELYLKVVDIVPDSAIVPQALFDASTQFLQIENWRQAIATLNVFQQRFAKHELYDDASDKLVYAYLENGEAISAAEKLVQVSNDSKDSVKASNALYRAAEIYNENGFEYEAVQLFSTFSKRYGQLYGLNVEAFQYIIAYHENANNAKDMLMWQNKLISYEKASLDKRTARSSFLAGNAALSIAMLDVKSFEALKLTLPLKKSLNAKKKSLKKVVSVLESLADYQVAEIMSAATYQIGLIYRSLAQDLLHSERPSKLSELELEQYDILLEEQAYPFEEQAFDIFDINIAKVPDGQFDKWIEKTYNLLKEMNPTQFERQSKVIKYAEQPY